MRVELGSAELAQLAAEVGSGPLPELGPMEHGGVAFDVLGRGGTRLALLGPDGVVYKPVLPGHDVDFLLELAVFEWAEREGVSWCPDFWPYEEHYVMAMRRYSILGYAPNQPVPDDPTVALPPPVTGYEGSAVYDHMVHMVNGLAGGDAAYNAGTDEDGRVVLIDGGGGFTPESGLTSNGEPAVVV